MKVIGLTRLQPLQTDETLRGAAAAFVAELRVLSCARIEDVQRRFPLAQSNGCRLAIPLGPTHVVDVAFNVELDMALIEKVGPTDRTRAGTPR
ncbi:hypothetical protein [Acuticoccus sediminis]|uniref:hypothetical protein n=1 Tax=Acuticoccus sediminis TaxID=2184697 RepID=UPI0013908AD5|nr:hypothetical protein [Acuticoccus sediminis]